MIKLDVIATYYNKTRVLKQSKVETFTFYDINEAIAAFEKKDPRCYINKKDISVIEDVTLTYNIELGYKRYYKTIDPTSETIESNYKKD